MISTVEVEETISFECYKTIRIRVCLQDEEMGADELGDMARKTLKSQTRKTLKTINSNNLCGGLKRQWAYKKKENGNED